MQNRQGVAGVPTQAQVDGIAGGPAGVVRLGLWQVETLVAWQLRWWRLTVVWGRGGGSRYITEDPQ